MQRSPCWERRRAPAPSLHMAPWKGCRGALPGPAQLRIEEDAAAERGSSQVAHQGLRRVGDPGVGRCFPGLWGCSEPLNPLLHARNFQHTSLPALMPSSGAASHVLRQLLNLLAFLQPRLPVLLSGAVFVLGVCWNQAGGAEPMQGSRAVQKQHREGVRNSRALLQGCWRDGEPASGHACL